MKSNPGGQIPVSEIIGRDKVVSRFWQILERRSLVLTAERRMGKTHIVKKMMSSVPAGILVIPGNNTPQGP
jgi:ATP-dependent Clp protease ATP-binding subunit ClpA